MQRKIVLKQTFSCMLFQTCCVPELNHLGSPSHNLILYTMQCKLWTTFIEGNFHYQTRDMQKHFACWKDFLEFYNDIQTLTHIIPLSLIVG